MRLDSSLLGTEIETIGVSNTHEGGMKSSSLAKFIDLITVQAYSNPKGSIIRELTSNCFDAHIKWQKRERERLEDPTFEYNQPVILKYSEEEGQGFISFIDRGTGLSPVDMKEIYIDIGTSDKEQSDDFIGCYGVGSKSFLSYTPSVDLVTRVDGVEYTYLVYKNNRGLLEYDCVLTKDTQEHNGTEVKLCIGQKEFIKLGYCTTKEPNGYGYRTKDFPAFREELLKQLYYFDNVYTVGFDLDNDYQIYEADYFKIRNGVNPFKEMHLILGKVAYPIEWEAIGMERLEIPVGIKFNIGELFITISRENIRYSDEDKNHLVVDRIHQAIEEIKTRYNKTASIVDTLEEYVQHLESPNKILIIEDVIINLPRRQVLNKQGTDYINIDVINGLADVKWKPLAHLPIIVPIDPYFIFQSKGALGIPDGKGNHSTADLSREEEKNIFKVVARTNSRTTIRLKGERNKTTDNYLWWRLTHAPTINQPFFIGKSRGYFSNYEKVLELNFDNKVNRHTRYPINNDLLGLKKICTPITTIEKGKSIYYGKAYLIKEYKKAITKDLVARSLSYEKEQPSIEYQLWLEREKQAKKKKRPKLDGKITIYDLVAANSSTSSILDLASLEKYKGFIIYGEREKLETLQGIKEMLSSVPTKETPIRWKIVPGKIYLRDSRYHYKPIPTRNFINKEYGGKSVGRTILAHYGISIRKEAGRIFITAKSNHKLLQENPYFMHVDEFMSNNNRMFRNAVTSWYINKKLAELKDNHEHLLSNLEKINSNLYKSYKELKDWTYEKHRNYFSNDSFMETCYGVAKESGFLWQDKIIELEKISKWFEGDMQIFEYITKEAFRREDSFKDIIALLKMKHKRLSAEHYFVPTVAEEVVLEQAKEQVEYTLLLEPMVKKLLVYNQKQQA